MFIVLYFMALVGTGTSVTPKRKMDMYQPIKLPRPLQISDDELIIKDMSSFARNHSLSRTDITPTNRSALRIPAVYIEHGPPKVYLDKMWGLIRHILYAAQDRLKYLQNIIEKYQDDRCFRAGFIYTKLDQLMEDSRRIFSFAVKRNPSIYTNIILFRHLAKKNVDITYIVEFMFTFHDENLVGLKKAFASFAAATE